MKRQDKLSMSNRSRPVRSVRQCVPNLPEILAKIEGFQVNTYDNIRKEYNNISVYFKHNHHEIAEFWLRDYQYDYHNNNMCILLQLFIHEIGHHYPSIKALLDTIEEKDVLERLGVTRCYRNDKTYYRYYVGEKC